MRSFAIAFLFAAVLVACDSPQERQASHLERGIAYVEQGDDERAMVEFQNVLRLNPKNAEALFHIGQIHERAGRLPQAYEAYRQAAAERQGFVAANVRLGAIALAVGDLDAAAAAAEAILEADPANPDGLAMRGSLALRRGDIEAARDFASRALEEEPHHADAAAVLAAADYRSGDTDGAIERLDEAIAANPNSTDLRITKIMLLERQVDAGAGDDADIEAITQTYRELFALEPENALHRLALADFQRRQGNMERAQSVLRTAIVDDGLTAPHAAASLVALVRGAQGFDAAVAELEALMRNDPDDVALRFLLADLYASEEQFDAAEAVLAEIVADEDGEGATANDARAAMARIELAAGDRERARDLAMQVLAANESHRAANLVLGMIHLNDGRLDDALRRARTTLREEPNWVPGLRLVAEAHLRAGETGLAIDALRQVVRLDPRDVRSATRLASVLAAEGDYGAALKLWDQIARMAEDPSAALQARAELQMRQGNLSAAQDDIQRLLETPGQELTGTLMAGDLMLLQDRFDESRGWFARASSLSPEDSQALLGITRSYIAESDPQGALDYLDERIRTNPKDAAAYNLKGVVLARENRLEEAADAFREVIEIRPEWLEAYRRLGRVLRDAGKAAEAADVYRAALEQDPDDPNVLNELAFTYYTAGDHHAAADTYWRLLQIEPDLDLAAYNYAAVVALFLHDEPERLERAFEVADARFRASADPLRLDVLGWLYYHKGEYAAALPFLERAVSMAPDEPELRYHLGMALYRSGAKQRALQELARAIPDDADYVGVAEARATHAELKKDLESQGGGGPSNNQS